MTQHMTVEVAGQSFSVTLADNECARAFCELLPTAFTMDELNGNEKYCYFGGTLPSSPVSVGQIHTGDIMLYGDGCIVVFYKDFPTSYSYTRIGHIDDAAGLADALGSGSADVSFTL